LLVRTRTKIPRGGSALRAVSINAEDVLIHFEQPFEQVEFLRLGLQAPAVLAAADWIVADVGDNDIFDGAAGLPVGNTDLIGSRDTLREAFRVGLIEDGIHWMAMIQDRNLTSHSYNRATAMEIASHIRSSYLDCFRQLRTSLEQRQP